MPAASVAAYADHELITPPHALHKALAVSSPPGQDAIARAEAALARLSRDYCDWMAAECDRLEAARREVERKGCGEEALAALFRAAHDIKSEAATFGYPEVAGVAESLCRLIEHMPGPARIPIELVGRHVEAVRAVVREHARPDLLAVAAALTLRLREVTDDLLRRENAFRPDYLAGLFPSPP